MLISYLDFVASEDKGAASITTSEDVDAVQA